MCTTIARLTFEILSMEPDCRKNRWICVIPSEVEPLEVLSAIEPCEDRSIEVGPYTNLNTVQHTNHA